MLLHGATVVNLTCVLFACVNATGPMVNVASWTVEGLVIEFLTCATHPHNYVFGSNLCASFIIYFFAFLYCFAVCVCVFREQQYGEYCTLV